MDIATLSRVVLAGRPELFREDFAAARERLAAAFSGRSVLVIGAGGSIGRATAELLLECGPRRTLLVDLSENNLASVTRRLRNRFGAACPEFEAWPLDFTGPAFAALLEIEQPEVVLNFAAFKHVRSEKDQLSLSELIRVNVLGNLSLVQWALQRKPARVFAISTDKAANPANCMGASKRLMEEVLWAAAALHPAGSTTYTSTRFANVLFSDGSLPASFIERLEQRQPLAGPNDVERYFMTFEEAARLCLLAASHPANGEILVPRMGPSDRLRFDTIAERLLEAQGLRAKHYGADTAAALANLERDAADGEWPCLFGPSTTSGEKDAEEFLADGDILLPGQPYAQLQVLRPAAVQPLENLERELSAFAAELSDANWLMNHSKAELVNTLTRIVPGFRHQETGASLDQKL